jgi:hypothetical protein
MGVVAYRRRLTEGGVYRLALHPATSCMIFPSAMYSLFRVDQAPEQNGTAGSCGQCRPNRGLFSCPMPQRQPHEMHDQGDGGHNEQ